MSHLGHCSHGDASPHFVGFVPRCEGSAGDEPAASGGRAGATLDGTEPLPRAGG